MAVLQRLQGREGAPFLLLYPLPSAAARRVDGGPTFSLEQCPSIVCKAATATAAAVLAVGSPLPHFILSPLMHSYSFQVFLLSYRRMK